MGRSWSTKSRSGISDRPQRDPRGGPKNQGSSVGCENITALMGTIDLHTHSLYSDGTFTPAQVMELAQERDVSTVALTDHDTTAGLREAAEAGAANGVEFVPGVEFSTVYNGEGVHILCYFMDPGDAAFAEELDRLRQDRYNRGEG